MKISRYVGLVGGMTCVFLLGARKASEQDVGTYRCEVKATTVGTEIVGSEAEVEIEFEITKCPGFYRSIRAADGSRERVWIDQGTRDPWVSVDADVTLVLADRTETHQKIKISTQMIGKCEAGMSQTGVSSALKPSYYDSRLKEVRVSLESRFCAAKEDN